MGDQQTTGAVTDAKGKVEETAGKLTGNEEQELHGKAKHVQGDAQKTLGKVQDDVQDAVDRVTR